MDRSQSWPLYLSGAAQPRRGNAFVRQLFYWAAGGSEPFLGDFDQAVFDETAPVVWDYLNEIEPDLWREGQTYPELAAMTDLLANQEIDFNMEYDSSRASTYIREGLYPDTIRTTVFDSGTLWPTSAMWRSPTTPPTRPVRWSWPTTCSRRDYQTTITEPDVLGWKHGHRAGSTERG